MSQDLAKPTQVAKPKKSRVRTKPRIGKWPWTEWLRVAEIWLCVGCLRETARQSGVDYSTIQSWIRNSPEKWASAIEAVRPSLELHERALLSAAQRRAWHEVLERLDNGDEKVLSNGSKVRTKVTARDAAMIGAMAGDRLRLADGRPTRITASFNAAQGLRERFIEVAGQYQTQSPAKPIDVTDGELVTNPEQIT